jgi:hypothetical protein
VSTPEKLKQWSVDWEAEVEVTLTTTMTVNGSHVIEAATAEEAVKEVQADLYVDPSDLDLTDLDPDDFKVGDVVGFKLTTPVKWTA